MPRTIHAFVRGSVKTYFWLRDHILRHVPVLGSTVADITATASNTLIDSWRDSFRREPFYIPAQATRWMADRGVTPEYKASLQAWRQQLFDSVAAGLLSIITAGFAMSFALVYFVLDWSRERNIALVVTIAMFSLGVWLLTKRLSKIADKRPALADERPRT